MKNIFVALALVLASSAHAHGHHGNHGGHHRGYYHGYQSSPNYNWVAPAIVSGIIGYGIARSVQPTIVQPYYGVPATQMELPVAPYGFHWTQVLDAGCNCYRMVLIQN